VAKPHFLERPRAWLGLLLLSACAPAWASSYPGGLLGLVALVLALPGVLLVFFLAQGLRAAGLLAHAWVRNLFQGLVGLAWFALVLWPLVLGDGVSALVLGLGGGLLGLLTTAPAWRQRPASAESTGAPIPVHLPVRRWLAAYWIGSGLLPLAWSGPAWLRSGLPAEALLWALLMPWLVFSGPRLVGAVALLKQERWAHLWLARAT